MMKQVAYRLTPARYRIGEHESYYEKMAAKGLLLEKRGLIVDRFRREKPEKLQYRIEYLKWNTSGDWRFSDRVQILTEGELKQYGDCGWTLVEQDKECCVFSAPQGSAAPEINGYAVRLITKLNQIKKSYRNDIFSGIVWSALLIFQISFTSALIKGVILADLLLLAVFILMLSMLWRGVYGFVIAKRLLLQAEKNGAIDHNPAHKNRHMVHRAIMAILNIIIIFCLFGVGVERFRYKTTELPASADDLPYLLGEEALDAKRDNEDAEAIKEGKINYVTYSPTLIVPTQYHTEENLTLDNGSWGQLLQDVYITWSEEFAVQLAWQLTNDSVFYHASDFQPVEIDGLDLALTVDGGMELIAVKGSTVVYCIYIGDDEDDQMTRLLKAYADKLS